MSGRGARSERVTRSGSDRTDSAPPGAQPRSPPSWTRGGEGSADCARQASPWVVLTEQMAWDLPMGTQGLPL